MSGEEIRAKNLQSLLKFCLKADDGSTATPTNPEDLKEKAEWFQKFVQESSINFGQKMKEDLQLICMAIETNNLDDNVMFALEELQDITENVDLAKDFIKMGGFEIIKSLMELNNSTVTMEAAQLIGNVTQNDEVCQNGAINAGLVPFLLTRIKSVEDGNEAKRLVYALSCCIRGSVLAIEKYKSCDGVKVILDAMEIGGGEATVKCAFLLFCIVSEDENIKLNDSEFEAVVRKVLQSTKIDRDGMEHLLGLINLSLKRDQTLTKCCSEDFIAQLESYKIAAYGKDEYDDSVSQICEILKQLK